MKIAIIADIHGNYEALRSFPETYDELWVLGDLVNEQMIGLITTGDLMVEQV